MRVRVAGRGLRTLSRLALVGVIGGAAAACSSDASRLGDPFTNPFASNEPSATGSLPDEPRTAPAIRTGRIQSEALAAPVAGIAPRPVGTLARAAQTPLPTATRVASTAAPGWSAQGGTPITVGQGDGLAQMSTRFGVPASAILSANGLTSASQVTPGRQLVIPVYNASGMNPAAMTTRTVPTPAPLKAVEKKTDKVVEERRAEDRIAETKARKEAEHKKDLAEARKDELKKAEARKEEARKDEAKKKEEAKEAAAKRHVRPGQTAKAEKTDAKPEAKADPKADAARKKDAEAKLAAAKASKDATKADAARRLAEAKAAKENSEKAAKAETKTESGVKTAQAKPVEKPAEKPVAEKQEPASTGSVASASESFRWPAKGRVISGYGSSGNEGINIAVPEGTAVKAAEDGTVAYAGSDVKGYGKLVLVRHPNGYVSAYAHNGELDVKPGEKVKRGQTIAKSGASGNVTSPQLHFEIRKGGAPIDPMSQLASN